MDTNHNKQPPTTVLADIQALDLSNTHDLPAAMEQIIACNAQQFDPVRYRRIEVLCHRASTHRDSVALLLEDKALQLLMDYHRDCLQAIEEAKLVLEHLSIAYPQQLGYAQQLFSRYAFTTLNQLAERLKKAHTGNKPLLQLTEGILSHSSLVDQSVLSISFNDEMMQQEGELINELVADGHSEFGDHEGEHKDPLRTLTSFNHYRECLNRLNANNLVTREINNAPASAGPLNPQSLALKSLKKMRALSPSYLQRFIAHLETLMWLEQSDQ